MRQITLTRTFEKIKLVHHQTFRIQWNENWSSQWITLKGIRERKEIARYWYDLDTPHLSFSLPLKNLRNCNFFLRQGIRISWQHNFYFYHKLTSSATILPEEATHWTTSSYDRSVLNSDWYLKWPHSILSLRLIRSISR